MAEQPHRAWTAQDQTTLPPNEILHSGNAGVVVERVGQLRPEFRSEGRAFARELAEYLNHKYAGVVTVLIYEETFGTVDRIHWLIHLASLEAYETLVEMGISDEGWREVIMRGRIPESRGGGTWERMFEVGSLTETVLLPHSTGMYGTSSAETTSVTAPGGRDRFEVPVAGFQSQQSADALLHTGNCGILMHRSGKLKYEFRAEGRQFARALAENWNRSLEGTATVFLYEEAFGLSDRVHWFVHLERLSSYYNLMGFRARIDAESRELFTRQWIPEEKGGGGWERMFIDATLEDMALTPQHPGMNVTTAGREQ